MLQQSKRQTIVEQCLTFQLEFLKRFLLSQKEKKKIYIYLFLEKFEFSFFPCVPFWSIYMILPEDIFAVIFLTKDYTTFRFS